jgi:hypothetical protein
MPSVLCPAGHLIDLGAIPNSHSFRIYWDPTIYERLSAADRVCEGEYPSDSMWLYKLFGRLSGACYNALQCPQCARLLILDAEDEVIASYRQELPGTSEIEAKSFDLAHPPRYE